MSSIQGVQVNAQPQQAVGSSPTGAPVAPGAPGSAARPPLEQGARAEAGARPEAPSKEAVLEELPALNHFMQGINEDLSFGIHEESERFYVAVIDKKSGEVLRQFPPEEVLEVLGRIHNLMGAFTDRQA